MEENVNGHKYKSRLWLSDSLACFSEYVDHTTLVDLHKGIVFEQAETDSFFLTLCEVKVWDPALMSLVHDKK